MGVRGMWSREKEEVRKNLIKRRGVTLGVKTGTHAKKLERLRGDMCKVAGQAINRNICRSEVTIYPKREFS